MKIGFFEEESKLEKFPFIRQETNERNYNSRKEGI